MPNAARSTLLALLTVLVFAEITSSFEISMM